MGMSLHSFGLGGSVGRRNLLGRGDEVVGTASRSSKKAVCLKKGVHDLICKMQ
jgi:hypothetical protein